ncbi:hypothetical protein ACFYMW_25730 [Streptomyces sp. NPDC006692]|uniref:hypothetical protein n=1 Tax=unclassified Streptomyces TaxID=2593676 RepID=UPI003424CD32
MGQATNTTIALRVLSDSGLETVHVRIRATRAHRLQAEQLQAEEELSPLWTSRRATDLELQAWQSLSRSLASGPEPWSQALRRPALFRSAHPDWSVTAPALHEVSVSAQASRLAPRSVAPQDRRTGHRAPVVAVTVAAGGTGGTTVSIGLAAALARQGLTTAVILEPGAMQGPLGTHVAQKTSDWAVLSCPAPGRLEATHRHPIHLSQQLDAAQERADVVIVDPTGTTARGVQLPIDPDVRVVLPLEKGIWGPWLWSERQTLDHRPPAVQMAAWLSDHFKSFTHRYLQAHPPTPIEELLQLLDERFILIATARSGDATEHAESDDLYSDVADDAELLDEWWTPHSFDFECEPDATLPIADDGVLDTWRTEFLERMEAEGRQRFGSVWETAAAAWPTRNQARHQLGLHPTSLHPERVEEIRQAFLQDVAPDALEVWDELWPEQGRAWAEAAARGQDLTAGWETDIEVVTVPRSLDSVAADLASAYAGAIVHTRSSAATVLVRNKARREDRGTVERLEAVSELMAPAGITALCEIPSDMSIGRSAGSALLTPNAVLAEAFDRLAVLVSSALRSPSQPEDPRPERAVRADVDGTDA